MSFTKEEVTKLRQYSGEEFPLVINFMNKLGQEVSVVGYIPYAYKKIENTIVPNRAVEENYFLFNFGTQPNIDTKIYAPTDELHGVTLNTVETPDGYVIYENENYYIRKWDIRALVEDRYGDENYFTTSAPHWNTVKNLLGKIVIYHGTDCPALEGKECLITHVGRGFDERDVDEVRFTIKNCSTKHNATIDIKDFDKYFELVDTTQLSINL